MQQFFLICFFKNKNFFPKKKKIQKASQKFPKKTLQKKILFMFFSTKKFVFYYMFAKFSFQSQMYAISSLRSEILQHMGTSCLCNLGTCNKLHDDSWVFLVYLHETIHYKVFKKLRVHLPIYDRYTFF